MKIWANTIVNNEENFLWFSVMSVAPYIDKILIWDTGSNDNTIMIIKKLQDQLKEKIDFKEVGKVNETEFSQTRQSMLEQSKCDWILILDGDEVWWEDSIKNLVSLIKKRGDKLDGVVVPMVVPAGDIYHIQSEKAGRYELLGKKGHMSLKSLNRKIEGLHVDWPYGKEGFFDKKGKLIQERKKIEFLDAPFLHLTHLKRSNKKRKYDKFKYELGEKITPKFKYPEIFSKKYPNFITSPWVKLSGTKLLAAKMLTPLRKLKRIFI